MHRFYTHQTLNNNDIIELPKTICQHIHVLRLKLNDKIQLFNGDGFNYTASILSLERNRIIVKIIAKERSHHESNISISLIQCFSTSQKMDLIMQKTVELGVSEIYPVLSERSHNKFSDEKSERKRLRWYEIIYSACEQSGRTSIPKLHPINLLTHILTKINTEIKLILQPFSPQNHKLNSLNIQSNSTISIVIGPEGGFSENELKLAQTNHFLPCSIGPRILRTETAPIAVISSLQTLYGDFN